MGYVYPNAASQCSFLPLWCPLATGLRIQSFPKWLHNPCHLRAPQSSEELEMAHSPGFLGVRKAGRNQSGCMTHAISGSLEQGSTLLSPQPVFRNKGGGCIIKCPQLSRCKCPGQALNNNGKTHGLKPKRWKQKREITECPVGTRFGTKCALFNLKATICTKAHGITSLG